MLRLPLRSLAIRELRAMEAREEVNGHLGSSPAVLDNRESARLQRHVEHASKAFKSTALATAGVPDEEQVGRSVIEVGVPKRDERVKGWCGTG